MSEFLGYSLRYLGGTKFEVTISLGFDATGKRDRAYDTIEIKGAEKYEAQLLEIAELNKLKRKASPEDRPAIEEKIRAFEDDKIRKVMDKAKDKASSLKDKCKKEGHKKPPKQTFDDLFNGYLASHQGEEQLSIKTVTRYRQLYDLRIKDFFAKYRPEDTNALVVTKFFTELRQSPRLDGKEGKLSEQSIKHHWRLLFSVFTWALEMELIQKLPMQSKKRKKKAKKTVDAKRVEAYGQDQADKLFEVLEGVELKYKTIIYLAIDSGCRLGELVGLTWDKVDFKKGQIRITQAAQYISEIGKSISFEEVLSQYPDTPEDLLERRIVITPPKTDESTRTINISPFVLEILQDWQHAQKVERMAKANKWKESTWIFTDTFGDLINPNIPSKFLHQLLADNNLPKLRFHGLRHTCASLLLDQGQNIAAISRRLGHSNVSTTSGIYIHSSDTQDRESAAKMDSIYKRKKTEAEAK